MHTIYAHTTRTSTGGQVQAYNAAGHIVAVTDGIGDWYDLNGAQVEVVAEHSEWDED